MLQFVQVRTLTTPIKTAITNINGCLYRKDNASNYTIYSFIILVLERSCLNMSEATPTFLLLDSRQAFVLTTSDNQSKTMRNKHNIITFMPHNYYFDLKQNPVSDNTNLRVRQQWCCSFVKTQSYMFNALVGFTCCHGRCAFCLAELDWVWSSYVIVQNTGIYFKTSSLATL